MKKTRIENPELDRLLAKLWGRIMDIGIENVSKTVNIPSSQLHDVLCQIETIDQLPQYLNQLAMELQDNKEDNEYVLVSEWWK